MGKKRDRFWAYAEELKGHFICNYCKHEFPGGASRIKSHLAGVKGRDIRICDLVPEDVQKEAYEATQGTNKKLKNASISSSDKGSTIPSTSISTIQKEKIVTQSEEEHIDEIVLDDVVGRLVTKAFSLATKDIIFKWGFKEELESLFDSLYKIKVVLHQKRQVSDESVRKWLMELRDVAYEVNDVLEEFDYEIIRQKVQMDQVCRFSFCNHHDNVKNIKQWLDKLVNDVAGFGLRTELLKSIIKIRLDKNEDSFLNDSEVIGRECEVVEIVKTLISSSNQQDISVLPIVGIPGLGKTTLARVLYNHEEIKKHFDVLAWVHVGGNFDVEKISKNIRESLKIDLTNLEMKKYFLVLDDIWIEGRDKWDILRRHLVGINSNSRINIIVTTRSKKVADIMGTLPPHHLKNLSQADCWSILEKRVFADQGKSPTFDLKASGMEIAKRCRGVPLVARILGEAMHVKCDENEWLAIQNDKIWYLLDDDNSGIFPALKLCFDNLPIPSLKKCFAYCGIFPKDYDIKKDELIQYWMAEGFLELAEEANMVMEDIGDMYFNILLATSFFQNARKDSYDNIIKDPNNDIDIPKNMGRLTCLQTLQFFNVGPDEGYRIKELGCLKNLKGEINIYSLENVEDKEEAKSAKLKKKEIFKLGLNWNYSRVEVSYDKDVKVLEGLQPHPNLKSLTIQFYRGKKFPSWVGLSSLYHNLIEIKLTHCMKCEEVPTLGQLPCLRVLEMEGMEEVICIGSEFYFYSDGSYRNTTTLFSALRILKLVAMETLEEWKDAKDLTTADEVLSVFPCLEELSIGWCNKLRYLPDSLRTCVSLQKLVVWNCPELSSLPGVRSLQKLVVEDCPNLMSLPGVGSIIRRGIEDPPNGLQSVIYPENGDFRLPSTSSIHPSLQKLKLTWCGSLLLDQIQYFIALKILWIEESYEMVALPEWFGNLSSLQELYLLRCWELVHLPTEEAMRRLTQLKTLIIYDCPEFEDNELIKISHVPWVQINDR
ncbi:hypothetical protein ACB092_04G005200 [Castanea dentata]